MARDATINVSLTPHQLRLVRQRVRSGRYQSASEIVRESLRMLFRHSDTGKQSPAELKRQLERGYKATSKRDRKIANEWATLPEAWPEE